MKNLPQLLALHSVDGLGPIRLKRVLEYFEDPKKAWDADLREYVKLSIPENVLEKLKEKRESLEPEKYFEDIKSLGISIKTIFDETYPSLLKEIYDPPVVLYYKGNIDDLKKTIAVVGTRKITGYGKFVTEKLTQDLVKAGFIVVSGLARGVDSIAHKTTVDEGGRTIAVLGGGIRKIFPPENITLSKKIIESDGAIISEYPPDYPHLAGNFPSRNRIIAGLCIATLITEAAKDSGSLITARLALEQGREVFSVPGPITSNVSAGTAYLIKEGANLTVSAEDILETLGYENTQTSPEDLSKVSESDRKILEVLQNETKHIDEIARDLKRSIADVSASLLKMEILKLVKNLGGGNYSA